MFLPGRVDSADVVRKSGTREMGIQYLIHTKG